MTDDNHAAGYDFVRLGEGLAAALLRAAEDQVTKAQQILDQTKSMADIIRTQVAAQAKLIEEMNERFTQCGEQMLDTHRMLNGVEPTMGGIDAAPSPYWRNADPSRDPDANYPKLPRTPPGGVSEGPAKLRVLPPRPQ